MRGSSGHFSRYKLKTSPMIRCSMLLHAASWGLPYPFMHANDERGEQSGPPRIQHGLASISPGCDCSAGPLVRGLLERQLPRFRHLFFRSRRKKRRISPFRWRTSMKSPQAALTTATARAQTSCPVDRLVAPGKFATAAAFRAKATFERRKRWQHSEWVPLSVNYQGYRC